jgi:GNAT superfamily N-acetyltransferase
MELRVERVVNEEGAGAWHAINEVAEPFDHPGLLADPLEEVVAQLPDGTLSRRRRFYVAYVDGAAVAAGATELAMADNLHLASLELIVPPELRRRSYGRQMFEFLREQCRSAGRSVLVGQVGAPLDGTSAGESFAKAVGARAVLEGIRSELKLATIDRSALHALEQEALSFSTGYEVLQWIDRAPDAVLEGIVRLSGSFVTEAPMGELRIEAESWDAARIRESEEATAKRGRMRVATAAVHVASHRLVAMTEISVSRSRPQIAYQWGTIVEPEHRGHRLGMLIKVANLRMLERELTGVETMETQTAKVNAPMIAINSAIGFRAVERFAEWQVEI